MPWIAAFIAGIALAAGATGSLIERAAASRSARTNPLANSEEARLAGAKLYARECASCHGAKREGGAKAKAKAKAKAPPLVQSEVLEAAPGTLFWILRDGSLRRGMPSFAHLPEPTRWQIVTYLQSRTGQR
jgi:mono/diheme cytochrome c family protein